MTNPNPGPPGTVAGVLFQDPMTMTVQVRIARPAGDGAAMVARQLGGGLAGDRWELVEAGADPGPGLAIPTDVALALLDALTRHFGGDGSGRALRMDYDAERRRLDKVLDHLIERDSR